MQKCLSFFVFALITFPLLGEDKREPITLTPNEIQYGWILLFDRETTFGWRIEGDAAVVDGVLVLGGRRETTATGTTELGSPTLRFVADADNAKDAKLALSAYTGPILRAALPGTIGWCEYTAEASPTELRLWTRGSKSFSTSEKTPRTTISFQVPAGQKLLLRSVEALPSTDTIYFNTIFRGGPQRLFFDNSDLTDWKEYPGKKSKFSVTSEGWLRLKDGPGDLQTKALYDDFILQLECKTNGKQLNSGVFFRCRPGEYQQGYEAQIHNGFDTDKPKEYIVEEYDPKTHELKDKKKVKSPAIDYGTGAIYRRVPARKQTAKDGEWFTMTVIAHGRHIATWVNGIQMVDWTDNRPLKDNARNGCRLEKGAISLQGHDPTTDLVFRNIRIAELPKVAEKK